MQGWELTQERFASSSKGGGGLVLHVGQTTYITGLMMVSARSFVNLLLGRECRKQLGELK